MTTLSRLVEALQQPFPENFLWVFAPTYAREGDNACGCAIGLGIHLGILPHPDQAPPEQLLSHFYAPHLGLSAKTTEAIFYTMPEDETGEELPFTPELVLQRIKELT